MIFAVLLFTFLAGLVLLIYAGYPALLVSGILGQPRPVGKCLLQPRISVIVPAHNEESSIESKILNLLAVEYPRNQIEILIGSDGSTDHTEDIVLAYQNAGVKLVASPHQLGKSGIQNRLVAEADGEILVFSDADCLLAPDALQQLVNNFADPLVGLVTGNPGYSNSAETQISQNESIYLRYENWIRREESARGLLAVASGHLFGMRRQLWKALDPNLGDDFVLPLAVALAGYRNVVDESVHVVSTLSQTHVKSMFLMKMRIISKDLRGLFVNRAILNPFHKGSLAIGLWIHKLLRWLVPYFLLCLLIDNLFLLGNAWFQLLFLTQSVFYLIAICCWFAGEERTRSPWSIPLSFCLVNAAAFAGTLHFATGKKIGRWRPVR